MPKRTGTPSVKADPPKKRPAPKLKKVEPLPPGLLLTDLTKKQWKLGKSIGMGGFGEIYLATNKTNETPGPDSSYVVKIEPHSNGPLFTELHCLYRIGKADTINEWMSTKKLTSLGMPCFYGSGSFMYRNERYRFMVMERYGLDIHKLFEENNKKLPLQTVFNIGAKVLNVLEYIHSKGYIHADIKGSNLLLGYKKGFENEIYLVDYGLACKYETQGKHKEYKPDQRFAHDGTIEYTSRDAHIGVHSRRGDLEILGYNMLQWLCGRLPWEDNLHDPEYVRMQKEGFMKNIPSLMRNCFGHQDHPGMSPHHSCCHGYIGALSKYLEYINNIGFEMKPDYYYCRQLFKHGLKDAGISDTNGLIFPGVTIKKSVKRRSLKVEEEENQNVPKKIERPSKSRKPLNSFRNLRNSSASKESEKTPIKKGRKKNFIDTSLDNPTPAMKEMLRQREASQDSPSDSKKGSRSTSSKQAEPEVVNNLTPAMMEVIRMRDERLSFLGCVDSSLDTLEKDEVVKPTGKGSKRLLNASVLRGKTATKHGADMVKKKYVRVSLLPAGRKSIVAPLTPAKQVVRRGRKKKVDRKSMSTQTSPGVVLRSGKYKTCSPELF